MKRLKKISAVSLLIALCAAPAFSQMPMSDLQDGMNDLSADLVKSLPFNASMGLNWSDAYIGKLFPSAPPHFGVGVSVGATTLKTDGVNKLLTAFGADELDFMPMPAYAGEARIGGLFLPFDLGLKFGILPTDAIDLAGIKLGYTLFGASVRYALLEKHLVLPTISVGAGVNYLKGNVGLPIGSGMSFQVPGGNTLALSQPELALEWETTALDFTVQASKSLIIITPYLGLGVSYAWSKVGYGVKSELTYGSNPVSDDNLATLQGALNDAGLDSIKAEKDGFGASVEDSGLGIRAFGGLSLNLAVIKLDLTAMLNFFDMNLGASLGVRFQL
jgi:hypothetical protein